MKNSARGTRVALAAAVVAVMAMSAVSADAAGRRVSAGSGKNYLSGQSTWGAKLPSLNTMIKFWEPFGELPIVNVPRGGAQLTGMIKFWEPFGELPIVTVPRGGSQK